MINQQIVVDYNPSNLIFPKYSLLGIIGNAEAEEVAARILQFSKESGEWISVSHSAIVDRLRLEKMAEDTRRELININHIKYDKYQKSLKNWKTKAFFTFGVYKFIKREPIFKEIIIPQNEVIFSLPLGTNVISEGVKYLLENKFVVEKNSIYHPTEKLTAVVKRYVKGLCCEKP